MSTAGIWKADKHQEGIWDHEFRTSEGRLILLLVVPSKGVMLGATVPCLAYIAYKWGDEDAESIFYE